MITTISYFSNDEGVWEGSTSPPVRKLELGLALQFLAGVSGMSINHNLIAFCFIRDFNT